MCGRGMIVSCVLVRDLVTKRIALPPVRTMAVLVPDEDKIPCLSWVNVTDRLRRVGYLEAAPQSGPFRNGELVQFDWVPGYKYPLVIAGFGQA